MENKLNKKKILLVSLLKWAECLLMGIFVFLFFIAVSTVMGTVANILFGAVGVIVVMCVMADYGLKQGDIAQQKVHLRGEKPCRNFGAVIGLVSALPCYLSTFFLALSKLGIIGNFLPAYKLINCYFFPLNALVAHDADINKMNPMAFILFLILPLVFILSAWISFKIGYDQTDLKKKIVYKN